jgi:hypothetical protein
MYLKVGLLFLVLTLPAISSAMETGFKSFQVTMKSITVGVNQTKPDDERHLEQWVSDFPDMDILGVAAYKFDESASPWGIYVYAAEFIREDPLEYKLHQGITEVLEKLPGVTKAFQEDREVWVITGNASGEELMKACLTKLLELYPELKKSIRE